MSPQYTIVRAPAATPISLEAITKLAPEGSTPAQVIAWWCDLGKSKREELREQWRRSKETGL